MKRGFSIAFLVFLLAACSPVAVSAIPPTTTLVPTVTPIPTLQPTLRPTLTPEPTTPTQNAPLNFFLPKVERRCPSDRNVSIQQLGIEPDSKIILTDPKEKAVWGFSIKDDVPALISKDLPSPWMSKISPNGNWIAYPIWNADSSSSIWILSLITGEQKEILNIKYWDSLAPYVTWLSDQELLVVNHCHTRLCHFPLRVVNINTGESQDVEINGDDYLTFFTNDVSKYALFSTDFGNSYANFFVYDYAAAQKISVFPWLEQKIFPYLLSNIQFKFSQTNLAMFVDQTYGFDVGILENSLNAFTKPQPYDVVMKRIDLGYGIEYQFDRSSSYAVGFDPSTDLVFLGISYQYDHTILENHPVANAKPVKVENGFFSMDYQHIGQYGSLPFTDYCFSMTQDYFRGVSPDGRIAVFESDTKNEITLMNIETGKLVRLPGWKFMGWRSIDH